MPKTEIDYSSTIIYKITCKDPSITDIYVGHTTNFVQRKHAHKKNCINTKYTVSKCKLYRVIREHGGWLNWKMEIINFFDCKDHYEARQKEQEYFISLHATLNSIEPLSTPKNISQVKTPKKDIVFCPTCNINVTGSKKIEEHNLTRKHLAHINDLIPSTTEDGLVQKKTVKFTCKICYYNTSRHSQYERHLSTAKHISATQINELIHTGCNKGVYTCKNCNKIYKARNSLWYHEKKCKSINNATVVVKKPHEDLKTLTVILTTLIKSNTEIHKQLTDICKHNSVNKQQ